MTNVLPARPPASSTAPLARPLQVLCSVPDQAAALAEVRRVLRPGGRLLLIEHVAAAQPVSRFTQNLLNPLQRALADGCNLNRDTLAAVRAAGFGGADGVSSFEVEGFSLIAPHIAGVLVR
jgi:hypothetical protein